MIVRVLINMGSAVRAHGMMYKAVAQSLLLYGSDIWVVTGEMISILESFHHHAARQIMDMTETCGAGEEWEYPPVLAALKTAELHPIMEYIRTGHAKMAEKVA